MNEKCINKIGFIFKNAQINLINECVDKCCKKSSKKSSCHKANKYDFLTTEPIEYIHKKKSSNKESNNKKSNTISLWSSLNIDSSSNHSQKDSSNIIDISQNISSNIINISNNSLSDIFLNNMNDSSNNIKNNYSESSVPCNQPIKKHHKHHKHHKHQHHHHHHHHHCETIKFCTSLFSNKPKTCYITLCKQDLVSSTLALAVDFNECWNGFVSNLYTLLKGSFLISFNKCDVIITIYAELFKYKLCPDKDEVNLFFKYNIVPSVECSDDLYKMDLFYKLHNEQITNVRFYYDDTTPFNPIRHIVYPQL